MAPKRKEAPEEENDAPPAGPLKTKRFVVNLTRIKGSMGLGIDDQRATMSKARRRHVAGRSRGLCPQQIVPLAAPALRPAPAIRPLAPHRPDSPRLSRGAGTT